MLETPRLQPLSLPPSADCHASDCHASDCHALPYKQVLKQLQTTGKQD